MRELVNSYLAVGDYRIVWDNKDALGQTVSSGIYFYQMEHPAGIQVQKMMLMK